jgi:hypothetical protein
MLISVGTGAAPATDADVLSPSKNALSNLAGLPGALMFGASVDQDVNCRSVGRCVFGAPIDREIGDLIPRDPHGNRIPLSEDLGRAFLYARYNADLSAAGLAQLGLKSIDPDRVQGLASVDAMDDLRKIGRQVACEIWMRDFEPFLH